MNNFLTTPSEKENIILENDTSVTPNNLKRKKKVVKSIFNTPEPKSNLNSSITNSKKILKEKNLQKVSSDVDKKDDVDDDDETKNEPLKKRGRKSCSVAQSTSSPNSKTKTLSKFKIHEDQQLEKKTNSPKVVKGKKQDTVKDTNKKTRASVGVTETKKKPGKTNRRSTGCSDITIVETNGEKFKNTYDIFNPPSLTVIKTPPKPSPGSTIEKKFKLERDIVLLESIFPNIDRDFLKKQYIKMKRSVDGTVNLIANNRKTFDETPESKTIINCKEVQGIIKKYTSNFDVNEFIQMIPDPWNYFLNTESHNSIRYADHSLHYLKCKYPKHYVQTIQQVLVKSEYSLYRAHKELSDKRKHKMYKMRTSERIKNDNNSGEPPNFDYQYLLEVAFIEHEEEIKQEIKKLELEKFKEFKSKMNSGSLKKCQYCPNKNLLWENLTCCYGNHVICQECLNNQVRTEIANKNFELKCPMYCDEYLQIDNLKNLLSPNLMAIIIRRKQYEELLSAGIKDILYCPSCYYVKMSKPQKDQKIFYCINPACMKESCLKCHRDNHEPFSCDDVIDSNDADEPTPDFALSVCFNCKKDFIKVEDTIKMVCSCGNEICYYCRLPYLHCPHFNGNNNYNNDNTITVSDTDTESVLYKSIIKEEPGDFDSSQFMSIQSSNSLNKYYPSDSAEY